MVEQERRTEGLGPFLNVPQFLSARPLWQWMVTPEIARYRIMQELSLVEMCGIGKKMVFA